MSLIDTLLDWIGRRIADTLEAPVVDNEPLNATQFDMVHHVLRPADVLLVEGRQKLATAIKYVTQSTWSHAALYAGNLPPMFSEQNAVSSVVLTHGYPLTCRGKQKCNRAV